MESSGRTNVHMSVPRLAHGQTPSQVSTQILPQSLKPFALNVAVAPRTLEGPRQPENLQNLPNSPVYVRRFSQVSMYQGRLLLRVQIN